METLPAVHGRAMETPLAVVSLALATVLWSGCGGSGSAGTTASDVDAGGSPPTSSGGGGSGPADGGAPVADAGIVPSNDAAGASPEAGTLGTSSATLGFVSGYPFSLYASIGGGPPHMVQLDTGSIGLYVPKGVLGGGAQVSATDTCSITYVSSGNTLSGHKATAPVTLLGSKTTGDVPSPPTTVPMSLCAVDDATWTGGMMGVGFGRGTAPFDPTRNVLLEMADVAAGTMHAGYVLSTHPSPTVQIGLTSAGSAGFQTIPLTPDPGGSGDWVATSLRGCLSLPSAPAFAQSCGGLLVDTGVAELILWGPSDPTLGGVVPSGRTSAPAGTSFLISAPASGPILSYSFVLGTGADTPSAVTIRTAGAFSINTGRALLVDYDYLFDAKLGLVGFRHAP